MDHYILLLKHLSSHIDFITNGFKRLSWTNSTDPRQLVRFDSVERSSELGLLCFCLAECGFEYWS